MTGEARMPEPDTLESHPRYTVTAISTDFGQRVGVALWDDDSMLMLTPGDARRFAGKLMRTADDLEGEGDA